MCFIASKFPCLVGIVVNGNSFVVKRAQKLRALPNALIRRPKKGKNEANGESSPLSPFASFCLIFLSENQRLRQEIFFATRTKRPSFA
jgi:hypothetical protein